LILPSPYGKILPLISEDHTHGAGTADFPKSVKKALQRDNAFLIWLTVQQFFYRLTRNTQSL